MSLGEKLRRTLDEKKRVEEKARIEKEEAQIRAEREEQEAVHAFFYDVTEHITRAIENGETVPVLVLGHRRHGRSEDRRKYPPLRGSAIVSGLLVGNTSTQPNVTDPKHKYHDAWCHFKDWAKTEGLNVGLRYEHDGVGMHSWHVITVEPAAA